jgi:carbon starvation protein CstA
MKTDARKDLWKRPNTRLGRWSVVLGVTFLILFLINSFVFMPATDDAPWRHTLLPFYGIGMLLVGLSAGTVGIIAMVRQHERSWLKWPTILPGLWVLFMVIGEFLVPH